MEGVGGGGGSVYISFFSLGFDKQNSEKIKDKQHCVLNVQRVQLKRTPLIESESCFESK